MSDYQRFISYLYEYKQNSKTHNRGFLKAESRYALHKLEIHIKDPALPAGASAEIYGFTRNHEQLIGNLLGTCQSDAGNIHCTIESSTSDFPLFKGIIILCNHVFSYASAWDDLPIIPGHFITPDQNPTLLPEEPVLTAEEIPAAVPEYQLDAFESFNPFTDGFCSECVKLTWKDFQSLQQNRWFVGNNPFITRSYAEHQHLILGSIQFQEQPTYIFGIPGTYHPQEKFMAQLYGFPYFKSANHPYGYWYRTLP